MGGNLYITGNVYATNLGTVSTLNLDSNASNVLLAPSSNNKYKGYDQELIIWNIDQTANRTGIRDNQRTFYGTY